MEKDEIKDLLISALIIAFVFSYQGLGRLWESVVLFPLAIVVVSLGFVFHELGHKFTAQHFGAVAKFKMWAHGLLFAVVIAIASNGTFVFAAPGAVYIFPKIDLWGRIKELSKKENGIISVSGPIANMILSLIGFVFLLFYPGLEWILVSLISINLWLGLFNMIPFPPLDGSKIFAWNKIVWALLFIAFVFLFFQV